MVKITCDVYCSEIDKYVTFESEGSEVFFMSGPVSIRVTLLSKYGDEDVREINGQPGIDFYRRKIEIDFCCLDHVLESAIAFVLRHLEKYATYFKQKVFHFGPATIRGADGKPIDINISRFERLRSM